MTRFVVVALFFDALVPLFPSMVTSYRLTDQQFQMVLGACYFAFAGAQLVSVSVISRLGLYGSVSVSCLGVGIAALCVCLADDAMLFATVLVFMFACNSIGSNATRVALRDASSDHGFKRLTAWLGSAVEIQQIAMPFLAGAMIATLGWRWALMALVAPVMVAGMWIGYAKKGRETALSRHATAASDWRKIASMPAFLRPTLLAVSFELAFMPISVRLPFVLSEEAGLEPFMMGLALSAASVAVAAGLLISGWLAPHRSSRMLVQCGAGMMAAGLACMLMSRSGDLAYAIVGMVIVQAAFGFIIIPCSADAMDACPSHRARASALFGFIQPVAGGAAMLATGAMEAPSSSITMVMTAVAFCLLSVLLVAQRFASR
ncbi:MAG: MFS transporter [Herbaspirillum sp.]